MHKNKAQIDITELTEQVSPPQLFSKDWVADDTIKSLSEKQTNKGRSPGHFIVNINGGNADNIQLMRNTGTSIPLPYVYDTSYYISNEDKIHLCTPIVNENIIYSNNDCTIIVNLNKSHKGTPQEITVRNLIEKLAKFIQVYYPASIVGENE